MKCPFFFNAICRDTDFDPDVIESHLTEYHSEKQMLAFLITEYLIARERKEFITNTNIAAMKEAGQDYCYICHNFITANQLVERTHKGNRHANCVEK